MKYTRDLIEETREFLIESWGNDIFVTALEAYEDLIEDLSRAYNKVLSEREESLRRERKIDDLRDTLFLDKDISHEIVEKMLRVYRKEIEGHKEPEWQSSSSDCSSNWYE